MKSCHTSPESVPQESCESVLRQERSPDAGLYVYEPSEWESKGLTGTELADQDLKQVLEGLAKHLFGDVEVISNFDLIPMQGLLHNVSIAFV